MTKERLNELLGILLKKDESVETTAILEEIRQGFNQDEEFENLKVKYKELEENYISTFKGLISPEKEDKTPPKPKEKKVEMPAEADTTIDDLYKE